MNRKRNANAKPKATGRTGGVAGEPLAGYDPGDFYCEMFGRHSLSHTRKIRERLSALDHSFLLDPGETIHGITRERIRLPGDVCGTLEGRSRFARLGLMIHVTSAFVQPGVHNRQVLEMSNVSSRPLLIHAGTRICQIVLMRTEGEAFHDGRFARQDSI